MKIFYTGIAWIPGVVGKVTCKLVKFMGVLSIAVSIITLVFITVDPALLRHSSSTSRCTFHSKHKTGQCSGMDLVFPVFLAVYLAL